MTSVVPDRRVPVRSTDRGALRTGAPVDVPRPRVRTDVPRSSGSGAVRVVGRPRGLSAPAAVALVAALALLGAGVGALLGAGGRSVGFVVGCLLAAVLVRRDRLPALVIAVPLLHAGLLLLGVLQDGSRGLVRVAMELFTALVLSAPAVLLGTLAVLVVAAARRPRRR